MTPQIQNLGGLAKVCLSSFTMKDCVFTPLMLMQSARLQTDSFFGSLRTSERRPNQQYIGGQGGVHKLVRGRFVNRPLFWDNEVGVLLVYSGRTWQCCKIFIWNIIFLMFSKHHQEFHQRTVLVKLLPLLPLPLLTGVSEGFPLVSFFLLSLQSQMRPQWLLKRMTTRMAMYCNLEAPGCIKTGYSWLRETNDDYMIALPMDTWRNLGVDFRPPPPHIGRGLGTIWQIGALIQKLCAFCPFRSCFVS